MMLTQQQQPEKGEEGNLQPFRFAEDPSGNGQDKRAGRLDISFLLNPSDLLEEFAPPPSWVPPRSSCLKSSWSDSDTHANLLPPFNIVRTHTTTYCTPTESQYTYDCVWHYGPQQQTAPTTSTPLYTVDRELKLEASSQARYPPIAPGDIPRSHSRQDQPQPPPCLAEAPQTSKFPRNKLSRGTRVRTRTKHRQDQDDETPMKPELSDLARSKPRAQRRCRTKAPNKRARKDLEESSNVDTTTESWHVGANVFQGEIEINYRPANNFGNGKPDPSPSQKGTAALLPQHILSVSETERMEHIFNGFNADFEESLTRSTMTTDESSRKRRRRISPRQAAALNKIFQTCKAPDTNQRSVVASQLGMTTEQVSLW